MSSGGITRFASFRLTLSLVISVSIIVTVLTVVSYLDSFRLLEEESVSSAENSISQTGVFIDHILEGYTSIADSMAHDQELLNKLVLINQDSDPESRIYATLQIEQILESYNIANRSVGTFTIISGDQTRVISSVKLELRNPHIRRIEPATIRQLDWFTQILDSKRNPIVLDTRPQAFVSMNVGIPHFAVAQMVRNPFRSQELLGIILLEIPAQRLEAATQHIRLGDNSGFVVVSEKGTIVYSPDKSMIGEPYAGWMPTWIGKGPEVGKGTVFARKDDGNNQYYAYYKSPMSGWNLIAHFPKDELLKPVQGMLVQSVLIAVMFILIAAFGVWYLVERGIGKPLRRLRDVMKQGETGNLSVRTMDNADNEIGDLGRAFNSMMDTIALAYYDPLTNLPNRRLLVQTIRTVLEDKQPGRLVAVLFIDLDRFKIINDTLGHQAGDLLIQAAGRRIQASMGERDMVARISGDEFVVLMPEAISREQVEEAAVRLIESLEMPMDLYGQEVYITASVGMAFGPADAEDAETLIKCSDIAMYEAKSKGRNRFMLYHSNMTIRKNERLRMENDLHRALQHREFELYYQPRINARTGLLYNVEALLRWNRPSGLVMPDTFISVAEETGLIVPIGKWVLEEACRQYREWLHSGIAPQAISVNVSVKQVEPGLVTFIEQILLRYGMQPSCLELEITEGLLMDNEDSTRETLRRLKAMGIRLSVDDFGVGYSSLAYLKKIDVSTLKIDKSFIRDIPSNRENQTIVTAIIRMAHNLGMNVVAEGVETEEEFRFLAGLNTDEVQGYWFSRPLPRSEFVQYVAANQ
ncbi:EAL domain-containing protein [Cohnella sp. CFH 77786]|uniref:bifunctional diguanylate cyclase/phosphodiesterase n=1 Tax=Cohnella sp. CFH 77786 TaxID=2662265 RepID=UPI001C60CE0B|nr:EAL domain-containing protein [Cohnella sp. CFH 77786]MBW5447336.1 EAL domain-containing protein [Cohnella sp. CFH 77786]